MKYWWIYGLYWILLDVNDCHRCPWNSWINIKHRRWLVVSRRWLAGPILFHFLSLFHWCPLHRSCHGADPVEQGAEILLGAVRSHISIYIYICIINRWIVYDNLMWKTVNVFICMNVIHNVKLSTAQTVWKYLLYLLDCFLVPRLPPMLQISRLKWVCLKTGTPKSHGLGWFVPPQKKAAILGVNKILRHIHVIHIS